LEKKIFPEKGERSTKKKKQVEAGSFPRGHDKSWGRNRPSNTGTQKPIMSRFRGSGATQARKKDDGEIAESTTDQFVSRQNLRGGKNFHNRDNLQRRKQ